MLPIKSEAADRESDRALYLDLGWRDEASLGVKRSRPASSLKLGVGTVDGNWVT